MMLLLFLLTAASATVPPIHLDSSSTIHQSPFYPDDDTRIRWSQCSDYGKALCYQSSDCEGENAYTTTWSKFDKATTVEGKKKTSCSHGQMIKPINEKQWLVFSQFAALGLERRAGIKLYIYTKNLQSGDDITYDFGVCAYDESTQTVVLSPSESTDKSVEKYYVDTNTQKPSIKTELLHGFVDEYGMSCIFSIKATEGPSIEAELQKVYNVPLPGPPPPPPPKPAPGATASPPTPPPPPSTKFNKFKDSKLITAITRFPAHEIVDNPPNFDHGVVQKIETPDAIETIKDEMKLRVGRGLKKEKVKLFDVDNKDVEFKRNFTYEKVNTDFNTMGCSDKAARLVVHQDNGLREVTKDYLENATHYTMMFSDNKKTSGVLWPPQKTDLDFYVGCIKRSCHLCDPLEPLLIGCDGCSPPLPKLPMTRKDCPILQCDSDQWLFNDTVLGVVSRRDEYGIECRKGEDQQPGWFRSNGHGVTGAACAPSKSCTILSPLNATICNGVNTTDYCVIISDGKVSCPPATNLLYRSGKSFELMDSSLHCDFFTGTWYYGGDAHKEFNTSIELKCEARTEKFDELDSVIVVSAICAFVGIVALIPIFAAIEYCWKQIRKSHLHYRTRPVNPFKRPVTQWPPAYADLTEVTDIMATPKADFYGIIQEWSMYSVVERVKFCTNLLDELGLTVKIDHYLSLFGHCVQMESDYRVWRRLVLGYKTILVGFNSVNRSRVAMKFQADLILCMNRLLNRLGYDHVEGADESLNFVRDICFSTFLACNNQIGIAHLYEEGLIRDGCEDIRKRRQIFACQSRMENSALNVRDCFEDLVINKNKVSHTKMMYGIPMPDDEDVVDARRAMRRQKGIFEDETQPEKYRKIIADREAKVKYDELAELHGSWREHTIYALCVGPDPDNVNFVIDQVSKGDFLPRELVNAFRASVEDCFDMRYAAREAFIKNHKSVREKCPIGSAEYMEIFEMFMRFAHLEYNETDETWLMKHVGNPGYFEQCDKEFLPITRLSEQAEYGRKFMAMLQQYKIKHILRKGEYQKDDETPRAHSPVRPMAALPDPKAGATESALRSDELEPYQSSGPGSSDNGPGFGSATKSNQRSDTKSKAASGSASRSKQGTASNSSAPKPDTASNSKQEPGPGSKAPGPAK